MSRARSLKKGVWMNYNLIDRTMYVCLKRQPYPYMHRMPSNIVFRTDVIIAIMLNNNRVKMLPKSNKVHKWTWASACVWIRIISFGCFGVATRMFVLAMTKNFFTHCTLTRTQYAMIVQVFGQYIWIIQQQWKSLLDSVRPTQIHTPQINVYVYVFAVA